MVDSLAVGAGRHLVHGLVECDVTVARSLLREEQLSLTAFVVSCLARALVTHPRVHAARDWRGRLALFDTVDVATLIESEIDSVAVPHVIRGAESRSVRELHEEIRRVQREPGRSEQRSGLLARMGPHVPRVARRAFLRGLRRSPDLLQRHAGTAVVTSVGAFGAGGGWAIPIVPLHTVCITIGGLALRAEGSETREHLALTVSVDHDLVDGAPAARFLRTMRELLESGSGF